MAFDYFGLSIGALVIWGFFMASLLHVSFYILAVNKNVQALACASILAVSYSLSDLTTPANFESFDFAIYFLYDVVTLAAIVLAKYLLFRNAQKQSCYVYCCTGLAINAILFLVMFIDSHLLGTKEPWALWYFYSSAVNIVDLIMVSVVILNRDFLGLQLMTRKLSKDPVSAKV
ncbi:hypothetical protein N476_13660 [Pseudoalteromonas luteoviolacea H33]|uniref:Membrane protein triplicated sequence n=2 Tax=Pseudoalteromonas luteoviolacea TaxID=43657 RepID=A0A167EZZ8_9GAMM|nr:hypothetical protein N476_13660 [Pseudoalteromonas luteoviolacea H33]KZN71400.1 hypothetical protein N477_03760 [Pseudoalteromonas luteoviolacea H33-S]